MESTYQFHFGGGLDWTGTSSSLVAETGKHVATAFSVKEYAYNEDSNSMYRPYMEDTHSAEDNFGGDSSCGYFGVYDGHGGKTVSDYVAERVPEQLKKELFATKPSDLVQVLEDVFLKVDGELKLMDSENTGSTGAVAVIRNESGHRVLYIANVGDTWVVISRNGVAERMSYDHKSDDPIEQDRIRLSGGIVMENRVGGQLAVSRAFGDYALK